MGVETCRETEGWGQRPGSGLTHPEVQYLRPSASSAHELLDSGPGRLRRNRAVMRPYLQMALMEDKALTPACSRRALAEPP